MPAATLPAQQGTQSAGAAGQPAAVVPFSQASHYGMEQGPSFTVTQGTTQQTFGPFPLPATGYLRRVLIEVTPSGGTAGTALADYPASIFALIRLTDTNGAPIYELSGYNTLLADMYGGYAGCPDWRQDPDYSTAGNTPTFTPYVPLEIDASGMGSPANLSASSAYRLTCVVDTLANNYSANPSPVPVLTVQVYCDFWTLPNTVDGSGRQQAITPPYPGTLQLWSQQPNVTVNAGANRIPLNRMGNLLRTVLIVTRVAGARSDTNTIGDPITLRWDDINLQVIDRRTIRKRMREYLNDWAGVAAVPTILGAYVVGQYNHGTSRLAGGISVVSWLPTVSATRYEISTPSGAGGASTLDWIINDVSVASTAPQQRATVGGTGVQFHPPVAPVVPGTT